MMHEFVRSSDLSEADITFYQRNKKKRIYDRGENIFQQDKKANGIYCIQSGYVLLNRIDRFGNVTAFRIVGPGELIGYRSYFAQEPHVTTAKVLSRAHVCYHPGLSIQRLIQSNSNLAGKFMKILAQDPGPSTALKLRSLQIPLKIRLVYLILMMKDSAGIEDASGDLNFQIPVKRREIAALLGSRPESVTRVIKELEKDGIVIIQGRNVTIPHIEELFEMTKHKDKR